MPVLKSRMWHTPCSGGVKRKCEVIVTTDFELRVTPLGPGKASTGKEPPSAPLVRISGFKKAFLGSSFVHEGGVGHSGSLKDNRWYYLMLVVDEEVVILCCNNKQEAKKWEDFFKYPIEQKTTETTETETTEELKLKIESITKELAEVRAQKPLHPAEITDLAAKVALRGEALKQAEFERLSDAESYKSQIKRLRESKNLPGVCPECHLHEVLRADSDASHSRNIDDLNLHVKTLQAKIENCRKFERKTSNLEARNKEFLLQIESLGDEVKRSNLAKLTAEQKIIDLQATLRRTAKPVTLKTIQDSETTARISLHEGWKDICSEACLLTGKIFSREKLNEMHSELLEHDLEAAQRFLESGSRHYSNTQFHNATPFPAPKHNKRFFTILSEEPVTVMRNGIIVRSLRRGETLEVPTETEMEYGDVFTIPVEVHGYIDSDASRLTLQNSTTTIDLTDEEASTVVTVEQLKSKTEVMATVLGEITFEVGDAVETVGDGWIVVGHEGASISSECRKNSEVIAHAPHGTCLDVGTRRGNRLQVMSPPEYSGWISMTNYTGTVLCERACSARQAFLHMFHHKSVHSTLQQSVERLQIDKSELEAAILDTTRNHAEAMKGAQQHLADLEDLVNSLEDKLARSAAVSAENESCAKHAEAKLIDAEARQENILVELNQKQDELETTRNEFAELRRNTDRASDASMKLSIAMNEIEEKTDVIAEITKEYDAKIEENNQLQAELLSTRADVVKAKQEYSEHLNDLSSFVEAAQEQTASLEAEKSEHVKMLDTAKKQLASLPRLEADLATAKTVQNRITVELQEKCDALIDAKENLHTLEAKLEQIEDKHESDYSTLAKQYTEASLQLDEAIQEITCFREELSKAEQRNIALEEELGEHVLSMQTLQQDAVAAKQLHNDQLASLKTALQKSESHSSELTTQIEALKGDDTKANEILAEKQSELVALQTQIEALEEESRLSEEKSANLVKQLEDASTQLAEQTKIAAANSTKLDETESCLAELRVTNTKAQDALTVMQTEKDEQAVMLQDAADQLEAAANNELKHNQLQTDHDELTVMLKDTEEQVATLREELETVGRSAEGTSNALGALAEEKADLADNMRELEAKLATAEELSKQMKTTTEERDELTTALQEAKARNEELEKTTAEQEELTTTLQKSEANNVELSKQLEEQKMHSAASETKYQSLQKEHDEQAVMLQDAEERIAALHGELDSVAQSAEGTSKELGETTEEKANLAREMSELTKNFEASEQQCKELSRQIENASAEHDELKAALRQSKTRDEGLSAQLEEQKKLSDANEKKFTEAAKQLSAAEQQHESLMKEHDELGATLQHAEEKILLLNEELETVAQSADGASKELGETADREAALVREMDEVVKRCDASEQHHAELSKQMKTTTEERDELTATLQEAKARNEELSRQLEKTTAEQEKLAATLQESEACNAELSNEQKHSAAKHAEADKEHQSLQQKYDEQAVMLQELNARNAEQNEERNSLQQECDEKDAMLRRSEEKLTVLDKELAAMAQGACKELDERTEERNTLAREVSELTKSLEASENLRTELIKQAEQKSEARNAERENTQDKLKKKAAAIEKHATEISRVKQQLLISGDVVSELRAAVKDLTLRNQKQSKQLDEVTKELTGAMVKEDKLSNGLQMHEGLVTKLQLEASRKQAELDILKATHEKLRDDHIEKVEKLESKIQVYKQKAASKASDEQVHEAVIGELRERIVELEIGGMKEVEKSRLKDDEIRRLEEWSAQQACEVAAGYQRVWSRRGSLTGLSEDNNTTCLSSVATDVESLCLERRADIAESTEWKLREENDALRSTVASVTQKYKLLKKKYAEKNSVGVVASVVPRQAPPSNLRSCTLRERAANLENRYQSGPNAISAKKDLVLKKQRSFSGPAGGEVGRTRGSAVMEPKRQVIDNNMLDDSLSI
eukprot:TRINITY_DN8368_c1_g1_i1.p1 TRINITY_DN8368_c1_g1~~TRINITY_DN8368_c1_g1_i1.p1  ORF type:complete len:1959 (+),score=573.76 TRINITY_DN8368_c1_g1_i1:56-5878(+)